MTAPHTPFLELRALASLAFHLPGLGARLSCDGAIRRVGTLADSIDAVHPSDFRDLVGIVIDERSTMTLRTALDLPQRQPLRVIPVVTHPLLHLGAGIFRASGIDGVTHAFATNSVWSESVESIRSMTPPAGVLRSDLSSVAYREVPRTVAGPHDSTPAPTLECRYDFVVDVTIVTTRHLRRDDRTHTNSAADATELARSVPAVAELEHRLFS